MMKNTIYNTWKCGLHALAILICLIGVMAPGGVSAKTSPLIGKSLDNWTLPVTTDGQTYNQANLKGKVVVLDYWGVR